MSSFSYTVQYLPFPPLTHHDLQGCSQILGILQKYLELKYLHSVCGPSGEHQENMPGRSNLLNKYAFLLCSFLDPRLIVLFNVFMLALDHLQQPRVLMQWIQLHNLATLVGLLKTNNHKLVPLDYLFKLTDQYRKQVSDSTDWQSRSPLLELNLIFWFTTFVSIAIINIVHIISSGFPLISEIKFKHYLSPFQELLEQIVN